MYTLIIEDKTGAIADEFSFSDGSFHIGRVEGNDIVLPSTNVSRQHSRLFVQNGACYIEDLGSSNGVFVDGHRISGQRDLGNGAQIRIGDYYLYLEYNSNTGSGENAVLETHIVSHDENTYKIVRIGDSFAGEEFTLSERDNSVGRTDENYILLNDASISRKHALIENNGLVYKLIDMGSSNGTLLNGKPVTQPAILKDNDHVTFGNVEFVFIPNETPYNPEVHVPLKAPAKRGMGGALIAVGILVFILAVVAVVAVGALLIKRQSASDTPPPSVEREATDEEKVIQFVEEGRAQMSSNRWEDAVENFDNALQLEPDNSEAKELREQAKREVDGLKAYNAALDLKGQAKYDEAKDKLGTIAKGTGKYERAQDEIQQINNLLAGKFKKSGMTALERKDWKEAHDDLTKAAALKCTKDITDAIAQAETGLKRERKEFEAFKAPADCK